MQAKKAEGDKTGLYFKRIIWYNTVRCMDYTKSEQQRHYCICAAVAQLDRVPDSDSGGRGFESRRPYQMLHVRTLTFREYGIVVVVPY